MKLEAYTDAAGVWTIGYGHTTNAGKPAVYRGMRITKQTANEMLIRDLTQYEAAVENSVKVKLNDNQFAALVSFTYNVGISNFKKSNLLKKLNQGDYAAIPAEFSKWTKAGKKRLSGLVNRRSAEIGLWAQGSFVASADVKPTVPKLPIKDAAEGVAPLVAAAPAVAEITTGTGPFQWALAILTIICVLVWAYFYFKRLKAERT